MAAGPPIEMRTAVACQMGILRIPVMFAAAMPLAEFTSYVHGMNRMNLTVSSNPILRFFADAGVLRSLLFGFTLLTFVLAPRPGTLPLEHGWPMVSTLLVPLSIPVLWVSLLMDGFMARLLMLEHEEGPQRRRLRRIIWTDLALVLIILLFWIPYFRAIK